MIQGQDTRTGGVGEYAEAARERLETGLGAARASVADFDQRARTWLVENPVLAVACAIGLGYLVGRISRRKF